MIIEKLRLLRYGHFEDHELDLAPAGLTIVYGPNEAGKSTSLAAITDLLYGFSRSCPYNFRWENSQLRVGATVANQAGEKLSFVRRKGNANTVMAEDESLLPDSVLLPFIGGTRSFFESSFGLSHDRLREGGDAIERADGDLGQILFEAGSGITSLAEIQKLLDQEADAIFGPRKSASRVLYQSIDAFNAASASLREATLNQGAWKSAEDELAAAQEALTAVQSKALKLQQQQDELNRWRDILPLLADIDRLRHELDELGPETALPQDARERFAAAVQRRTHGRNLVEQMEQAFAEARDNEAACVVNDDLLDAAEHIQELYGKAGVIENEIEGLPELELRMAAFQREIAQLIQRFNLPMIDGQPHLPRQSAIADLTSLIASHKELERDLEQARQAEDLAAADLEQLKKEVSRLGDISSPRQDIALLKKHSAALAKVADSSRLERDLLRTRKNLETRLASLDWWSGDAAALAQAKLPTPAQVARAQTELSDAQSRAEKLQEKLEESRDDLAAARHRLSAYTRREAFFTEADLKEARHQRQAAWSLVRQVLDGNPAPTAEAVAALGAGDALAPAYESLAEKADSIADGRFNSVEKIVEHNKLQGDVADKEHATAALEAKGQQAQTDVDTAMAAWRALWQQAGVNPGTPEEMKDGLATVDTILEALAAEEELASELESIRKITATLHDEILEIADRWSVLLKNDVSTELAAEKVQIALDLQNELYGQAETLRVRIADREGTLLKAQQKRKSLKDRRTEWETRWSVCCTQAGLESTLSAGAAQEIADAWDALRQQTTQLDSCRHQREKTHAELHAFVDAVKAALSPFGDPADDFATPAAAVASLRNYHKKIAAEERLAQQRDSVKTQIADISEGLQKHQHTLLEAENEIRSLLELAHVETEDELPKAIADAENQRKLRSDLANARQRLLASSEGEDENRLRTRAAGHTLSSIRVDTDEISIQLGTLNNEIASAAGRESAARVALETLNQKGGAHIHAQSAQNAIARMELQTRDYLRLRAASILLRHGIERIREKHKNPIVTKASAFFQTITGGSFEGLLTDYENDNPTIVGLKPDKTRVYTSGMSTGTRDQLYLALRLAFIEDYCANEEPLPFIGDDLFVHFDEPRTAAGLKVLAQLTRCQVLLFTHHDHVIQTAREAVPTAKILNLSEITTAIA